MQCKKRFISFGMFIVFITTVLADVGFDNYQHHNMMYGYYYGGGYNYINAILVTIILVLLIILLIKLIQNQSKK